MTGNSNGHDLEAQVQRLERRVEESTEAGDRAHAYAARIEGHLITGLARCDQAVFALTGEVRGLSAQVQRKLDDWLRGDDARRAHLSKMNDDLMQVREERDELFGTLRRIEDRQGEIIDLLRVAR